MVWADNRKSNARQTATTTDDNSSSAQRLLTANKDELPQIMLKNLEMLSNESGDQKTVTDVEDALSSNVSTVIKEAGQKIIEDKMRQYITHDLAEDIENYEDLLGQLRRKRLSIQTGVIDKLTVQMNRRYDNQKRESYDFVKKQNDMRQDEEYGTRNSMEDAIRESFKQKGQPRSVERNSLNMSKTQPVCEISNDPNQLFIALTNRRSSQQDS